MTNPAHGYTRTDIIRWLGSGEVRKASGYLNDVTRLSIQPTRITAEVQGTARRPYRVEVVFDTKKKGAWEIQSSCSCPVGRGCKHAAAILLVALQRRDRSAAAANQANPEVLAWAERLRELTVAKPARRGRKQTHVLLYAIEPPHGLRRWNLALFKAALSADGGSTGRQEAWHNVERALLQPPSFIDEDDLAILRLLWGQRGRDAGHGDLPLAGRHSAEILQRIAASGRAWFKAPGEPPLPLEAGEIRHARLSWQLAADGISPRFIDTDSGAGSINFVLPAEPAWYIDLAAQSLGPLDTGLADGVVPALLDLPPLSMQDVPIVADTLAQLSPGMALPSADLGSKLRVIDCPPVPVLSVGCHEAFAINAHRGYHNSYGRILYDYAQPSFRYADAIIDSGKHKELVTLPDGETVRVIRRPAEEKARLAELKEFGFETVPAQALLSYTRQRPAPMLGLPSEEDWEGFRTGLLPRLRAAGWEVRLPADFRHNYFEITAWHADINAVEIDDDAPGGWFDVDLGIDVEGQRLPLAPLLFALFRRDPRWLAADSLKRIRDADLIELEIADGGRVRIPAGRLKPLAATLIELFDAAPGPLLRVPKLDAPRLLAVTAGGGWQTTGEELARGIVDRLKGCEQPVALDPPPGFGGTLRPYQREGLGWLQYLREHGLAGILADDMGLGKTAQALAHLLTEKAAGRLNANGNGPALVVLPTSLVFNWKREAAHFAPELRVLSLHGPDRKARFGDIPTHDVVLTTYPLLWRDEKELAQHAYHLLILDEAQTVKNAASRAADVVRSIDAKHRLCITGTPLENHLGELWAQVDFLMPGLLGDARSFARMWRTPIEKHGDAARRDLLARRIRPFILRRRKEDVAKELPPKTVIVRSVELDGGQRDLYETVRSAMDQRVRDEIAARGFARSQIVILDALLKLRQVCCDPRLLKTAAALKVKERAKLDLLMDMLPELVDEGRKVLVFSQFTSMLALIERELTRIKLPYALLTGDTGDRETPISRFQNGEVPVFLISLKAGGVGLNLTAADTVIHYDPWWNPAVENQATDRAHRIGQTRNVFVYKLVVAGSIEEKILALQEKKAELAAGVLSEDGAGIVKFGESELRALLEPLAPLMDKER